jgi:CubicO group peptidase (beta-lactamase class C family)
MRNRVPAQPAVYDCNDRATVRPRIGRVDERDLAILLREHASMHAVPGAAVGILQDGVVATAYFGVADVRTRKPVSATTRFSVGSLTKSMVATVISDLAQAGRLSLDDPAGEHVPELAGSTWAGAVTLRDLLANRSGLPLRADLEYGFAGRSEDDDDALSRLAADVGSAAPEHDFWSYTNAGWCLLGRVIETATGTTWEEAMQHSFGSHGMQETTFAADAVRSACGHEVTAEGALPVEPLSTRAYGPAGTNTVSTVADLLRFAGRHLDESSLAGLRAVHARVPIPGWLDSWCLGWGGFDWAGGPVWGWDGLVSGERSVLRIVPEQRAAVVLLTNASTGRAMHRSLLTELMDSRFGIGVPPLRLDPSPGAAGDLSRFAGVYAWPDERVKVTAVDSGLIIKTADAELEALPLDERSFVVDAKDPDNPTVTFGAFDATGRPQVLYLMVWAYPRVGDERHRDPKDGPHHAS